MKKISTPHKNNFIQKDESRNPNDITIEDIIKWKEEMDNMGIPERTSLIDVNDLGNGMVELIGNGIFGRVPKKIWNDALLRAAGIDLPL